MSQPEPETATPEPAEMPAPHAADWWQPLRRTQRRLWWAVAALVVVALLAGYGAIWWSSWNKVERLEPSGGLYFPVAVELPVPLFRQNDPRWGQDQLAATEGTLGAEGCAVSSAAMVLAFYGFDTDPQRLNAFLQKTDGGYTPEGWIYWEKAAEQEPGKVRHAYEALGSYRLLDENLLRGNPVIVKIRFPHGTTHFVVVAGKRGHDYLTRDPGAGASKGLYPLRELGSKIEGLRFYEPL